MDQLSLYSGGEDVQVEPASSQNAPAQQSAPYSGGEDVQVEPAALEVVRYDAASGLVPVVVQDVSDGAVLMVAYANREALKRTLGTGQAWFWSRSRQSYWRKGETSGHLLHVAEVRVDCDGDTVLYRVQAAGPACHTGRRSCFYRRVSHGTGATGQAQGRAAGGAPAGAKADDPQAAVRQRGADAGGAAGTGAGRAGPGGAVTGAGGAGMGGGARPGSTREASGLEVLARLWQVVVERDEQRPAGAYTTYLFEQGIDKVAKKVGEEAVEVAIAAKNAVAAGNAGAEGVAQLQNESADLLYHLLVLWRAAGITPVDVAAVLDHRAEA